MKIKNLKIEGYKNLEIDLIHNSDIIALIGNNGSGKSNLLEALSLIFRSLYKVTESVSFDYFIEYVSTDNRNIKIDKKKSKITFKVDDATAISIDEYLPKKVVALYSGEEQRLWNKIYYPIYDDFIKSINKSTQIGILTKTSQMPQMLYLNKYYWHLSLLSLIISDLEDNKNFVRDVLKINVIDKIKFLFNKANYKAYSGNEVLNFISKIDTKSEYTLEEFKSIIADNGFSDADVFNYLYVANSPKGTKIIDDIIILYNEHLNIEDFSEGEKKLLLIKAAFEFAEQEDSLFILDEPDAHIHLNNKDQIIKTFEPYKKNRQIVITTHSPTVTQSIDDDNSLFMISKGKIIERLKQEIIGDLTDDFWNKHQQSSFLSSQKKLILLVEGKHDKLHVTNAFEKLKEEFPNLDFDIFSIGGEGKIHPFMNGLYEANIQNDIIYIGIYDNDNAGLQTLNKAGFEPDNTNCGYRKLKKDKTDHNHFFAFALIKPEGFTKDCTIENMFDSTKYEDAYKEALDKSIGNFSNKSIDDITKDIKENSKNILAENSKNFDKEDFKNFRNLFTLIKGISDLNMSIVNAVLEQKPKKGAKDNITDELIPADENAVNVDEEIPLINLNDYKNHRNYTSKITWNKFLHLHNELLKLNPSVEFGSNKYFVSLYSLKRNFAVIRFRKNSLSVLVKFNEKTVKNYIPNRNFHKTNNGTVIDNLTEEEDIQDIINLLYELSKIRKVRV